MKKIIALLLSLSIVTAHAGESIQESAQNTDKLYREGTGAIDGAWTATSVSMIGWGVGLALGIGLLAALLHQSTASHAHDSD